MEHVHPDYDPHNASNFDFALLKLEDPVNNVASAPIDGKERSVVDSYGPRKKHLFPVGLVCASGWGSLSDILRHVDLDFIPRDRSQNKLAQRIECNVAQLL